jgi:hypothetical protein
MAKKDIVQFIKCCKGNLPSYALEKFKACGWHSYNSDGMYTDISTDAFLDGKPGVGSSIDIVLTIVWEENSFYLMFGVNNGDGFNELASVDFISIGENVISELDVAVDRDKTGELAAHFKSRPNIKNELLDKLNRLQDYFINEIKCGAFG